MSLKKSIVAGGIASALLLSACSTSTPAEEVGDQSADVQSEVVAEETQSDEASQSEDAAADTIFIPAGDHDIPAVLVLPDSASVEEPVPAIVMLHGTGSQKDEAGDGYLRLASELADAGIASIRIDFMGAGESTAADKDFSLDTALTDGQKAIDYLLEQPEINAEEIGVLGWSQGGIHALNLASHDDRVRGVVTWASPSAPMEISEAQRAEAAENGYFVTEFDWREPMNTGQAWIDGMDKLEMEKVVSSINVPVLLINGENDDVVPPENADTLNGFSDVSEVLIIPGADHTFNVFTDDQSAFDQLSTATVTFFVDTLK